MKIFREGFGEIELTPKELREAYLEQLHKENADYIWAELEYMVEDYEFLEGKDLSEFSKEILKEFEERLENAEYEMACGVRDDFRDDIIESILEDYAYDLREE